MFSHNWFKFLGIFRCFTSSLQYTSLTDPSVVCLFLCRCYTCSEELIHQFITMAGTQGSPEPKASALSEGKGKGKGKEIAPVEEEDLSRPEVLGRRRRSRSNTTPAAVPQLPVCNCRNEDTQHHSIHEAFEGLVTSLHDRFQQQEPQVFDACCKILHQFTVGEMGGREVFDRLSCILVNDPNILQDATKMFAMYMSMGECVRRHTDIAPMDSTTFDRIMDFYGCWGFSRVCIFFVATFCSRISGIFLGGWVLDLLREHE